MKNTNKFLTVLSVMAGAFLCTYAYAADYPTKSTDMSPNTSADMAPSGMSAPAARENTVTGKIESVTLADASRGTPAKLVILDKNGRQISYEVSADAGILNANKDSLSLSDLRKGADVEVHFTSKRGGIKEVTSIDMLKSS